MALQNRGRGLEPLLPLALPGYTKENTLPFLAASALHDGQGEARPSVKER